MADIYTEEFDSKQELTMEDFNFLFIERELQEKEDKINEEEKGNRADTDDDVDLGISDVEARSLMPSLEELAFSDYIHNRQLAAKRILEFLHEAGSNKEELQSIISVMCKLSEDEEVMVRTELMEHIPSIALFCKDHFDELGAVIRQQLVPYAVKLLTDNNIQVRKVGHSSLLILLENNLIDKTQLSEWICPLIAQLASTESNLEELRAEDVSVMSRMIPLVGKEITIQFFLEPFVSLCCDSAFTIRKVCANSFGCMCKIVGTETAESTLLPAFRNLCSDEAWAVRKCCADVFVDVAGMVSLKTRKEVLPFICLNLLDDESRYVKHAAYQSLGGFISTFADPQRTGLSYEGGTLIKINTENSYEQPVHETNSIDNLSKNEGESEPDCNLSPVENSNQSSNSLLADDLQIMSDITDKHFCDSPVATVADTNFNCISNDPLGANAGNVRTNILSQNFDRKYLLKKRYSCEKNNLFVNKSEKSCKVIKLNETNYNSTAKLDPLIKNLSEEVSVNNKQKKDNLSSSLDVAAKDGHVYLHVDNENLFNNFQFWRLPLPEVELDIDIEGGVATNIHVRARVHCEDASKSCASDLKVRIASDLSDSSDSLSSVIKSRGIQRVQVQTECANSFSSIGVGQNSLDDDAEVLSSSFNESILTFKDDELLDNKITLSTEGMKLNPKTVKCQQSLSSYDQDIVPPELLRRFILAVVLPPLPYEIDRQQYEDEKKVCCAYSFPAVAYTLGRKYWSCIKCVCDKLARDMKWTVRRTIASSLHELAVILGHDIVVEDLLPIFLELLKDVDEVRLKLILHLSDFLKHLEPRERSLVLPLVEEFTKVDNDNNWRFRCAVAQQLRPSVELYSPSDVQEYFLPITSSLLQDRVSDVRKAAVELMAVVIKWMSEDKKTAGYSKLLLAEFDARYRQAHKWLWRQTYVFLCEELAVVKSLPTDTFVDEIVPNLFSLAWDSVPNVRLAVSRCLALTLLPRDYLPSIQKAHYQLLLQVMYSLQSDVDKDVRHFAHLSAGAFNVLPSKKLSPV